MNGKVLQASAAVPIDKLMFWRAGTWVKYDTKPCDLILRLVCDQLLITNNKSIVETLNVTGKVKGIYKGDILILIIGGTNGENRKIKFQIKSEVDQCLQALRLRFPLLDHSSPNTKNVVTPSYRNIEDVVKRAAEIIERNEGNPVPLPQNLSKFIKLCLLDPQFPSLVNETRKILENDVQK